MPDGAFKSKARKGNSTMRDRRANGRSFMRNHGSVSLVLAVVLLLASCDSATVDAPAPVGGPRVSEDRSPDPDLDLVTGQTIFVPAYTEILLGRDRRLLLSTSIAIHNAAVSEPLIVQSVRHYDTDGNLIKEYVEQPLQLGPLATRVFAVERPETGMGAGSNFIVEWAAQKAIYEPVVEAVMVGSAGTQGFSLISPERVMKHNE